MINTIKLLLILLAIFLQYYYVEVDKVDRHILVVPVLFSSLSLLFVILERRFIIPGFLLSSFCIITSWRLSSLAGMNAACYVMAILFVVMLYQFKLIACNHMKSQSKSGYNSLFEWQSIFIRLFLGYDLIPHFSEKLMAGSLVREGDVKAFLDLGIADPLPFVIAAGIIEFCGSLSLSCGILTRLGSVCLVIYLIVATIMGHHFDLGFIWANPGGGWEYPVLWSSLILTYAFTGANSFSIDRFVKNYIKIPKFVEKYFIGM